MFLSYYDAYLYIIMYVFTNFRVYVHGTGGITTKQ